MGNKKQERAAERRQADKDRRGVKRKVSQTGKNDQHGSSENHSQNAKGAKNFGYYGKR